MKHFLLLAGTLAFLGACSSGGGCDGGGGDKKAAPAGESTGLSGGGSHGGTPSETVSFQGLGKKSAGDPTKSNAPTAAAAAALGGSAPNKPSAPPQSVLCGGFPNLPADCLRDPAFDAIKAKCCPTGYVEKCQGIPGGARLSGSGCTAQPQ